MTTVTKVADEITFELRGSQREELNILSATITSSVTSIGLTYPARGIANGAYIAIDDEVMYVFDVASSAAVVRRGMLGTTAAAHTTGAVITVNPAHPQGIIKDRMKEEIRSWPTGLFRVATETLTGGTLGTSNLLMTAAASAVTRILDVRTYRDGARGNTVSSDTWSRVRSWEWVVGRAGADTSEIQVTERLDSASVWVAYASAFDLTTFTGATDLEADVGLPTSCLDILRMGTVMRMVPHREILRAKTDVQGQPRDAAEVTPGQNSQVALLYKQLRDQRIAEEAHRLREKWPTVGG